MKIKVNQNIKKYILIYGWSKNLIKLIDKEIEIDIDQLKIFPLEESGEYIHSLEIEHEFQIYYIPLDCFGYINLEIKKKYMELKNGKIK